MKVIAPADRYLVAIGAEVKAGDQVDVSDDVAASLIAQGWRPAKPAKNAPDSPAPAKPADPEET